MKYFADITTIHTRPPAPTADASGILNFRLQNGEDFLRPNVRFRVIAQNHTMQAQCAVNAWSRRFPPSKHLAKVCSIDARVACPLGLAAHTAHITAEHRYDVLDAHIARRVLTEANSFEQSTVTRQKTQPAPSTAAGYWRCKIAYALATAADGYYACSFQPLVRGPAIGCCGD